jgi:transposase
MEKAKQRFFTVDYKRQTVELVRSSGHSIGSVAAEIGLPETGLRKWVRTFSVAGQPAAALRRLMTQASLKSYLAPGPQTRSRLARQSVLKNH